MTKKLSFALMLMGALVACGDDDDTGETGETGETATEDLTWPEMDFDQRKAYMASDVMPPMQAAFAGYDAEAFETITCATCHGAGAEDGSFTMPAEHLYPIDFADFPTGDGADFMMNEVVPQMTTLLDAEPFDSSTGEGFGCISCHTAAE